MRWRTVLAALAAILLAEALVPVLFADPWTGSRTLCATRLGPDRDCAR